MEAVEETRHSIPMINETAPDFTAQTTQGEIQLSNITAEGKWVVLFSHPADFTPVCTTEFVGFAELEKEFEERNVQLIGLSIDSIFSHLAWHQSILQHFGVEIPFPVIADLDMKVASLYGMVHPKASSTAAVRAVFIIDPQRKVRAVLYYPLSTGRLMSEVLRLVDSLQLVDSEGIATPANWQPGDKVIMPPPTDTKALEKRLKLKDKKGIEQVDWYLTKKEL